MTFTTLISTGDLESMLGDPSLVLLDAGFSLDDEAWGSAAYGEAHILAGFLGDHGVIASKNLNLHPTAGQGSKGLPGRVFGGIEKGHQADQRQGPFIGNGIGGLLGR